MLQYVIAGLVLGGIYAIASAGLVITYTSAGILNFSFGAMAYFVARLFYYLHSQHHWSIPAAAALSLLVVGPGMGVLLYVILFRFLRLSSPLIKVVATLGVSVVIPSFATLIFGTTNILKAPGLAHEPVHVYKVDGVPVTTDQLIVYACVILTVLIGAAVLRYTDVGLRVRAMVDSPAMTSLSGTNPGSVAVGVWAVSTFLAGLSGVLSAPIIGLDPGDYTLLMAAAFAAVIAAKLRSLPVAVVVALAMGVAGGLVQHYMPPASSLTAAVIPSIPFAVTALFLIYNMVRWGRVNEAEGVGGALDRAITPQAEARLAATTSSNDKSGRSSLSWRPPLVGLALVALLPLVLHHFWVGILVQGLALGVVFLSFTLVTGEGGMIWLCQITFAGVGALAAAQLSAHHGWPVIPAIIAGGLFALPMGVIIGVLTIRLGDVYVALVTLTFGLLMEGLVFTRSTFLNTGVGVNMGRPHFAITDRGFSYLEIVAFCIFAVLIVNLRRSTTGLGLNAVRWSEPASKTIGLSVLQMKVLVAGLAAFVAGVGGALYAASLGVALPANYATFAGVIWLAVVVTLGIRSNIAAMFAGLALTLAPALTQTYMPHWFQQIPFILFGVGAVTVVKNPEGTLAMQARQVRDLAGKLRSRSGAGRPGSGGEVEPPVAAPPSEAAPTGLTKVAP